MSTQRNISSRPTLRILMQSRPNTFSQRGGDTTVLERLSQGLTARGHEVCVDLSTQQDPSQFDIVHLFNFATPALTQEFSRRAIQAGTPFVVTSLYEDVPEFHTPSHYVANKLIEYVQSGQHKQSWAMSSAELVSLPRATRFAADLIASTAAALFPNGEGEAKALRRDFPQLKRSITIPVGHEIGAPCGPELFQETYGISDFVLCVGRLESRKNQLMLLKALEESDLTVVLAGGGFSYQPAYEAAIRSFRRRGKTIITGRLSAEMLSSAYAACRVHVLPSWYELPGLVSLEAASHGKNIVVTRTGTTADYVGDKALYCIPWDADSILSAVIGAFYAPAREGLIEMARSFRWEDSVTRTEDAYREVLGRDSKKQTNLGSLSLRHVPEGTNGAEHMNERNINFQEALERGEVAAKNGDFETAHECLGAAEEMEPTSARALKARGAVWLAQKNIEGARDYFERALMIEPHDPKILTGRGMCEVFEQKPESAFPYFERAVAIAPDYLIAVHQILECSYAVSSFDKALTALERYLAIKPADHDMRFCYAGCLFKHGQSDRALSQLSTIMVADPSHQGARELDAFIRASTVVSDSVAAQADAPEESPAIVGDSSTRASLKNSLADLSQTIKSWRVDTPRQETPRHSGTALDGNTVHTASEGSATAQLADIEQLKRDGDFTGAMRKLEELMVVPDLSTADRETALCLQAEFSVLGGDFGSASTTYDSILADNPLSARALCGKGALAAEAQDWSLAQTFFKEALVAESNCDIALAGLGLCAMVENRSEDAFVMFQRAMEANPENQRALLGILQTGYPLRRFTEMERMISAYLDLHPDSIDMLYSLAGVLFAQGKVHEARLEVEKILVAEPNHEHALELRGMIEQNTIGNKTNITQ